MLFLHHSVMNLTGYAQKIADIHKILLDNDIPNNLMFSKRCHQRF